METMNTTQVAELLAASYESFLKNKTRYEAKLTKLGCVFTTEGRGKNTLYHFTVITKEVTQMRMAKKWEETFGFKAERPYLAINYFFFLTHEPLSVLMSDADVAYVLCGSKELRANVRKARMDLEKAGVVKPLNATEHGYTRVTKDGIEVSTKEDNAAAWHFFYEMLGFHAADMAMFEMAFSNKKTVNEEDYKKEASQMSWADMKEEWGIPKKVKRRELTGKPLFEEKE